MRMKQIQKAVASVVLVTGVSLGGAAQAFPVLDSSKTIWMNPYGECWVDSYGGVESLPVECGGPAPVVEAPKPAPMPAPKPAPVVIPTVVVEGTNFDFDKATLKPGAIEILDQDAKAINDNAKFVKQVNITGHTDSIGSEAYNQGLSERRAAAVADYLAGKGVSRDVMNVKGMGETQPVADNRTKEGRAKNRRVEVQVLTGE